ncbi:MAG: peptide chain release factor N(5)-glutamine methyltransferase [Microcoleus sp. PH2017_15_JOR_U_A]|uniref:N5-glutamine methyltransferase family protein n=1 Tax=unclassified Microcoleus TaxID=2642155 RepID=UPI001DB3D5FF|nr:MULTISPECIES: HemK/PrmC family methyltransferase [unclassified Microcoleus]MCC3472096.1 peptide chain release factor N(5)-glutamine methyltransferase [Microcoleus sp. PH2017_13_LAR_U_A]MCC3484643.1 peptide chain release factor N(5)-glutamine methyltransferase [Microcoleus sp. PH2017_14_LAR_D_A]MCC3496584.1 peptide chain release factor N(5)-glutamine methyltransferase [Microcoleus sp. PH2017_15_JOR_U_A]MCC3597212.1 peptide chain release factor N(5)-glutamine methyltransferase [Microcoleus sp.
MFVSGLELWQWVNQAKIDAIASEIPQVELDWLLQELAGLDKLALRLESFKDLPKIELKLSVSELDRLWQRRLQERVPVQYLTGVAHWRDFSLKVTPAVLIPRPETELLIDLAVDAMKSRLEAENINQKSTPPNPPLSRGGEDLNVSQLGGGEFAKSDWVDLGTGSGAIAIGLACALKNTTIHAVDCSSEALAVARLNAENLGFGSRINFYQGLWWEPLEFLKAKVSGMVSNPPYIPSSTVLTLQPEVLKHEPHLALDGGFDGLDCIRHLVETAPDYLESGGVWLVEMMAGQETAVADMLRSHGSYCDVQIFADLAGIDRFALAYRL